MDRRNMDVSVKQLGEARGAGAERCGLTGDVRVDAAGVHANVPGRKVDMIRISARVEFDRDRIRDALVTISFAAGSYQRGGIILDDKCETFVCARGNLERKGSRESSFEEAFVLEPCPCRSEFAGSPELQLAGLNGRSAMQQEIGVTVELPERKCNRLTLNGKEGQPETQNPSQYSARTDRKRMDFLAQTDTNRHAPIEPDSGAECKLINPTKSACLNVFPGQKGNKMIRATDAKEVGVGEPR